MARFQISVESAGRPLKGASIYVYTEKIDAPDSSFGDTDLATIYSDAKMETETSQPLQTDDLGEAVFFMPSGSQVAIKVSRALYGTKMYRYVDITGSDI